MDLIDYIHIENWNVVNDIIPSGHSIVDTDELFLVKQFLQQRNITWQTIWDEAHVNALPVVIQKTSEAFNEFSASEISVKELVDALRYLYGYPNAVKVSELAETLLEKYKVR